MTNGPAPLAIELSAPRHHRPWALAALGLVAVALVYGGLSSYSRVMGRGTDFNVFHLGGRLAVEAPEQLYEAQAPRGLHYTFIYPPLVGVLMWPLSALPLGPGAMVWFVVNVACTLHAAWILSRLLAPAGRTHVFFAAALVLALPSTVENIMLGQLHALLLYLMVLTFAGLRRGRPATGAVALGVATGIKLLPGILGVYFIVRRQWRALAVFVLTLIICSVAVPAVALGPRSAGALLGKFYEFRVAPYLSAESTQHPSYARTAVRKTQHDHDLGAFLMRHFTDDHFIPGYERFVVAQFDLRVVRSAMYVLFAVMLVISVLTVWPDARNAAQEPGASDLAFCLFVILSSLLSPRSRVAYWTVFMIPWAVLLSRLMATQTAPRAWHVAAWTVGISVTLCGLAIVPVFPGLTIGFWGQVVLWVGLLLLCRQERRAAPAPQG